MITCYRGPTIYLIHGTSLNGNKSICITKDSKKAFKGQNTEKITKSLHIQVPLTEVLDLIGVKYD